MRSALYHKAQNNWPVDEKYTENIPTFDSKLKLTGGFSLWNKRSSTLGSKPGLVNHHFSYKTKKTTWK